LLESKAAEEAEESNVRLEDQEDDIRVKYANFHHRLDEFRDQFKQVSVGYCRLMAMPRVMLGLVMASRLRSHFMHASWFKVSSLNRMIDVHAGVSDRHLPELASEGGLLTTGCTAVRRRPTVHRGIFDRKRGASRKDVESREVADAVHGDLQEEVADPRGQV